MKKTKTIIIALLVLILSSCINEKNAQDNSNCLVHSYNISALTKAFIFDICKTNSNDLEEIIPNKNQISKYALSKISGLWYFSGTITTEIPLLTSLLDSLQIKTNKTTNNSFTAHIPIKNIQSFFQIKGIKYFEISKKVFLK